MSPAHTGTMGPSRGRSIRTMAYHPAIPEIEMEVDSSVGTVITLALEGYDCWRVERPLPADRKEWPKIGEHTDTAGFNS